MNDISNNTLTGIDSDSTALVASVCRACDAHGVPHMLIGAFARDIWLHHCHGITPTRKTLDVDFAVCVADWAQYDSLREFLCREEAFRPSADPKHPQRLHSKAGTPLDVLPFGGLAGEGDNGMCIRWPDDDTVMSVEGFDLALRNVATFELIHDEGVCQLRVLTIPSLVSLKLVAWRDKGADPTRRKHVEDVFTIIENYPSINPEAVDGGFPENIQDENSLNAYLLGRDMGRLGTDRILENLSKLLSKQGTSGGHNLLPQDMKRHTHGSFAKARRIIEWLSIGLADGIGRSSV